MRDPNRIDKVLYHIGLLWRLNPDLRLMQLLDSVIGRSGDHFHLEDDVLDENLMQKLYDWGVQIPLPLEEMEAAS